MASGDTLLIFTALHNEPPGTNYATFDSRNNHPCLDFDAATNESAVFRAIMPQHYAGGGVEVLLHWAASTDTTNTHHCYWDAAFERIAAIDLDVDADSFADANSVDTDHCDATSGKITITTIAFTAGADMDSVAAGEMFRLKLTRDAANDDMTGDAELYAVEIREV